MTVQYIKMRDRITSEITCLTVQDQYDLAAKLAANCGYQLVIEDNERSLEIKELIVIIKAGNLVINNDRKKLLLEGLEALLK